MIRLKTFIVNSFRENTYLIWDEATLHALVIDAGCYDDHEFSMINRFISEQNLIVSGLLNTHCHIDHVLGLPAFKNKYRVDFMAHEQEVRLLENAPIMGRIFGITVEELPEIDRFIKNGEEIALGESTLTAIHVPGHSAGSLAFFSSNSGFVITGDALFSGSIGRTDLPGGDYDTLIHSIKNNLMVLPPETLIYPGHGESSSIAIEADSNPFL